MKIVAIPRMFVAPDKIDVPGSLPASARKIRRSWNYCENVGSRSRVGKQSQRWKRGNDGQHEEVALQPFDALAGDMCRMMNPKGEDAVRRCHSFLRPYGEIGHHGSFLNSSSRFESE